MLKTPYYLIDEAKLEKNLKILKTVRKKAGVKILLAQKAFSCYATYPLIAKYLDGVTASGLFEAKLGAEEMTGKENHVFNPAFAPEEVKEIVKLCGHVVVNSLSQLKLFKPYAKKTSIGLRVNPHYSEVEVELYNPCSKTSRFGVPREYLSAADLEGVDGLHVHAMCEQGSDVFERTLKVFEEKFGEFLPGLKWVNFGGGHHITKKGYDLKLLIDTLKAFKTRYQNLEVYLEPGEAIALNAGYLVTKVRELLDYGKPLAILDTSAACHMPDVIEMPYRPPLKGSGMPGEKKYSYIFGGPTCLAGDIIGEYSFSKPLKVGQELIFEDMAIYSMVKNNTFNGMPLPSIYLLPKGAKEPRLWKKFGYDDFKSRL